MNMPTLKTLPTLFIQAALIATATILALVLVTKYVAPIPLSVTQTTTEKASAFSATGRSTVSTIPDRVDISLGVSLKEANIQQAQARANGIIQKINTDLQALGVSKDDIKTQNYSIYPNYDYQNGGQQILGYSVDVTLTVSLTDFEKLNKAVDLATQAGANQVSGIQFTLSEEKEREVKAKARQEAIEDAKTNAKDLAGLAGMKLGKVVNIVEDNGMSAPVPYLAAEAAMGRGGAGGSPTNIQPGSTNYSYTVTISYETL
jgi:uncharacterized protein YggE